MAALKDKIQNGLDETRMLVLGGQVLLGFFLRAIFQEQFTQLPVLSQRMVLTAVALLLFALALLFTPGTFHRLVEQGHDSERLQRLISRVMYPVLVPFSVALGVMLYVAASRLLSSAAAWSLGAAGFAVAMVFFYVFEAVQCRRAHASDQESMMSKEESSPPTPLKNRIRHVLTEARVVIPGAQALLGFQFTIFLTQAFEQLPRLSKLLHLASVCLVGLATVLLLTPAAYHRIVEDGEETERFHALASRFLVFSLIPIGMGASLDFYVVILKVMGSELLAVASAVLTLALMFGLWFGFAWAARWRHRSKVGR